MPNPYYPIYNYHGTQIFLPMQAPPYRQRWTQRDEESEEEELHDNYVRNHRYNDDHLRHRWGRQPSPNPSDDEEEDGSSDNDDNDDEDVDEGEGEGYESREYEEDEGEDEDEDEDEDGDDGDVASAVLSQLRLSPGYGCRRSKIVVIKDMHLHMKNNQIENFTWNKKVKGQYRY